MSDALHAAVHQLDDIAIWDANETNYEEILSSITELQNQFSEWKRVLRNRVQSLWMAQASEYNNYRQSVERTLRTRHIAEIACLFPNLRSVAPEPEGPVPTTELDRRMRQHLFLYGFKFESGNTRLVQLVTRQLHESDTLSRVSLAHNELLLEARRRDVAKLSSVMKKTNDQVEGVVRSAEKKIAASKQIHAVPSAALYARQPSNNVTVASSPSALKPPHPPSAMVNATPLASPAAERPPMEVHRPAAPP